MDLPYELQEKILIGLNYADIMNYSKSCKCAYKLTSLVSFWRRKASIEGLVQDLITDKYPSRDYDRLSQYGPIESENFNYTINLRKAIDNSDETFIEYLISRLDDDCCNFNLITDAVKYAVIKDKDNIARLLIRLDLDEMDILSYSNRPYWNDDAKILADIYIIATLKRKSEIIECLEKYWKLDLIICEVLELSVYGGNYHKFIYIFDIIELETDIIDKLIYIIFRQGFPDDILRVMLEKRMKINPPIKLDGCVEGLAPNLKEIVFLYVK